MARIGRLLLILGIGSFILPLFHLQFALVNIFGGGPIVGLIFIAVGIGLMVLQAKSNA